MSNAVYAALSRQSALERELSSLANDIANASTAGFRGDAQLFSEYVSAIPGQPSLSQTRIGGRLVDEAQGDFVNTGGALDLAIEGDGYFVVATPRGERLTRAGAFLRDESGFLTTVSGDQVQGAGGSAISIPAGASDVVISMDGVISADGALIGQIRVVRADPIRLTREGATLYRAGGDLIEVDAAVRQGFVEASNVKPVLELSRLIEVQRAFELGQQLLAGESERIERAVAVIGGSRQQ